MAAQKLTAGNVVGGIVGLVIIVWLWGIISDVSHKEEAEKKARATTSEQTPDPSEQPLGIGHALSLGMTETEAIGDLGRPTSTRNAPSLSDGRPQDFWFYNVQQDDGCVSGTDHLCAPGTFEVIFENGRLSDAMRLDTSRHLGLSYSSDWWK